MKSKDIKLLKFLWPYMLDNGTPTTGKWCYYSCRYTPTNISIDKIKNDIKNIGVDWEMTGEPESSMENCFNGTFAESSMVETLIGTIYLKNGAFYTIGVDNISHNFSSYSKSLYELATNESKIIDIFGE